MIKLGENFSRCRKIQFESGVYARRPLVWLCFVAFVSVVNAQTPVNSSSDWSGLTPPPAVAADSNSLRSDFISTNLPPEVPVVSWDTNSTTTNGYQANLAMASYYRKTKEPQLSEPILIGLLNEDVPETIQKSALLELGAVVRDENDLPRAQTIYAQFINKWPEDPRAPEVFLRQGEIFRQMGLTDMALGKFYSVMASAIALKNDQLAYYQRLVLETQVEIAETQYLMGHYVDAADFYGRLLENPDPSLNHPQMQFRLIRSLTIIGHNNEAASQAADFLSRYHDTDETPEVRYYMAQALKALGRDDEALQQVLLCLQQQKGRQGNDPTVWIYWQQRVGNELADQLYHEGDYVHALEIYVDLAQLDPSPSWQVPVYYQMGLTYEKLMQPQKATDTYKQLIARETEVGTNETPGMKAVFDMARWRVDFLKWQTNAQTSDQAIAATAPPLTAPTNSKTNTVQ